MEMRECEARPGMIWACCAEAGRAGMSRAHVCVECKCMPFGSRAMMGLLVGRGHGVSGCEKMTCCARVQDGPCPYGINVNIDSL
jgi:hypothetical protein